ncbi:MAG TPA: DinB family protein [Thermomicrobiaceae bacterium]|nr:DinB family protein [Thermomicrobiaceae bacterium]
MDVVSLLREQLRGAHDVLESTIGDTTAEQAHRAPGGTVLSIAANYAHTVCGEDAVAGLIDGSAPLFQSAWAGRTGVSELPPLDPPWTEWAARVTLDLAQARGYAHAVYARTDGIVAALSPEDLERPLDLSTLGFGMRTVGFLLSAVLQMHPFLHAGEISAIKGLQGLPGYPF